MGRCLTDFGIGPHSQAPVKPDRAPSADCERVPVRLRPSTHASVERRLSALVTRTTLWGLRSASCPIRTPDWKRYEKEILRRASVERDGPRAKSPSTDTRAPGSARSGGFRAALMRRVP
jgi:hypothetical protein